MDTQNIANELHRIYQTLAFEQLTSLFAEDFVAHGSHMSAPMNSSQFIGFLTILTEAFSELDFHPQVSAISGNEFNLTWQLTGKHTGILSLSAMGLRDFEATQATFSLPKDTYRVIVSEGRISKISISPVEGGGFQGILAQLNLI